MGTVKYTGPVASFHCPTNAEIRSLKVHFSPKQEGTGDPSPENVREISGWDGVEVKQSGKNLLDESLMKNATYNKWGWNNILKPNTTYTWSVFGESTFRYGLQLGSSYEAAPQPNKRLITYIAPGNSGQFTTPSDMSEYPYIYIAGNGSGAGLITTVKFKLELGSTATSYEPYQGSTTNYEFEALGKNKFDINRTIGTPNPADLSNSTSPRVMSTDCYYKGIQSTNYYYANYTNVTISNGVLVVENLNNNSYGAGFPVMVKEGQEYTLSVTSENILISIGYYDHAWNYLSGTGSYYSSPITITPPSNASYALIVFRSPQNVAYTYSNIQLELGSTATAYEPYDPKHTVYGGWVDLISGEVCEEWYKHILDGTESLWRLDGSGDVWRRTYTDTNVWGAVAQAKTTLYSSYCQNSSTGNLWYGWISSTGGASSCSILFYIPSTIDTVDKWRAYLSENPLEVCYKLYSPISYHLAPTQLQTFLGQNNVWSNADYVEVEYDLHETQDILNRKAYIIANQPHVVKPAAASLQNFKTDVIAPLKECKVHFEPIQDLHGYSIPWPAGGGKNLCPGYNEKINIIPNTIYSVSTGTVSGGKRLRFRVYDINDNILTATISNEANYYVAGNGTITSAADVDAITGKFSITNADAAYMIAFHLEDEPEYPNVQVEIGSTATSYEPYENICPISGWTGIETYRTRKNIGVFLVNSFTNNANTYYNGNSGWCSQSNRYSSLQSLEITYSAFIDATNVSGSNFNAVKIWGKKKDGNWAFLARSGNNISLGSSGISSVTITIPADLDWIVFGLGLEPGATASNPMVEVGSTATPYESYSGTTIPITFPATKNIFDEKYENISNYVIYKSLYVGNSSVTASSDMPLSTTNYSNLFIIPGQVTSGASTGTNNFNIGQTRTVTPIDGYITIGYRAINGVDPRDYHAQIEIGNVATAYEPYGTVYGGYVDLVSGEVVAEWIKFSKRWGDIRGQYNVNTNIATSIIDVSPYKIETITSRSQYGSKVLCNITDNIIWQWNTNYTTHFYIQNSTNDKIYFIGNQENLTDETIIEFACKLLEPIHYQISLQILKTLRGTNNIWSNANGNIEISYWKH